MQTSNEPTSETPTWFSTALSHVPSHHEIEVENARVHLRTWGEARNPGLLFVHGGGAHSGWWDHIAPFFLDTHRIVAVDLTGHGDSDHRHAYDTEQWAREVLHAGAAGGIDGPPHVVGHSMGGFVTASLAAHDPSATKGQILVDTPTERAVPKQYLLQRPSRAHATADDICARFALTPPQEIPAPYVAHHVALQSVRETDHGWMWKFDSDVYRRHAQRGTFSLHDYLPKLETATTLIRCQHGLIDDDMEAQIHTLSNPHVRVVDLPGAGHHPMMDQPLALAGAVRHHLDTASNYWTPH